MNTEEIIFKYYPKNNPLRRLLLKHSSDVAEKALEIVRRHPELGADAEFVHDAAVLHDIGIFMTSAPEIHCHGTEPYILHGILGGQILRNEGLPELARVCERHTGTGITAEQIRLQHLPMPEADYCPETIEEIIVCYADKYFSKSHPKRELKIDTIISNLIKHDKESARRFIKWVFQFELGLIN